MREMDSFAPAGFGRKNEARIERIEAAVEPLFSPELPPAQSAKPFSGFRGRGGVVWLSA